MDSLLILLGIIELFRITLVFLHPNYENVEKNLNYEYKNFVTTPTEAVAECIPTKTKSQIWIVMRVYDKENKITQKEPPYLIKNLTIDNE